MAAVPQEVARPFALDSGIRPSVVLLVALGWDSGISKSVVRSTTSGYVAPQRAGAYSSDMLHKNTRLNDRCVLQTIPA